MNTAFQTPPADSQTACWYSPLAASRSDGASATSFSPFHYRRPLGWFRHRGAQEVAGKAEGCCSRACFAVLFFLSRHLAPPPQASLLTLFHVRGRKPADLTREGDANESLSNFLTQHRRYIKPFLCAVTLLF